MQRSRPQKGGMPCCMHVVCVGVAASRGVYGVVAEGRMSAAKERNPNRPKKGASIKVEPIRNIEDIQRIKLALAAKPRDLCLFTLGINTAFRAGELLSIKIGQVMHLKPGDSLELKQSKTKKYRATPLNTMAVDAIGGWLAAYPNPASDAPLFLSQKGGALTVPTLTGMVKGWCKTANLAGNYGSHTLRKTWGYQVRVQRDAPLPLLMKAFGHSTEQQTLEYLCIQPEEISQLYTGMEL